MSEEGAMTGKDENLNSEIGSEIMLSLRSKLGESDKGIEAIHLEKYLSRRLESLSQSSRLESSIGAEEKLEYSLVLL